MQTAEILAIGDELISGARVDTNSAWLSQRLAEIGWSVVRHTTIPDDRERMVSAMREANRRARVVLATGGLGPTADDLTRQALAEMAGVPLDHHPQILDHIRRLFERMGRTMPNSNRVQADLPRGAVPIDNPHGTAPGIDLSVPHEAGECRWFCLPGVPAEMHEMWSSYVLPALTTLSGSSGVWTFHTIHCFGAGESHIESMLPGLIERHRQPQVGITASQATISLRLAARGASREACLQQMEPTIALIRKKLGVLVYGEGDQTLADVVVSELRRRSWTVAVSDFFLGGEVGAALCAADADAQTLAGAVFVPPRRLPDRAFSLGDDQLAALARRAAEDYEASLGVVISPLVPGKEGPSRFKTCVWAEGRTVLQEMVHSGHPALVQVRSVKQVLNGIRLVLLELA